MIDRDLQERYELAKERLVEIPEEGLTDKYVLYCQEIANFFGKVCEVLEREENLPFSEAKKENSFFYEPIAKENYQRCYGNPTYACDYFGKEIGKYLCYFYSEFRDAIHYAYFGQYEPIVRRMELFLQVYSELMDAEDVEKNLKEIQYYYIHDYSEENIRMHLDEMLNPNLDTAYQLVMNRDHKDLSYLYEYGEPIGDNEIQMLKHLLTYEEDALADMARTFTEGFRQGFVASDIDLSKKETVNIRYSIGMEPMVREAIKQFADMGLRPILTCRGNRKHMGVVSTPANRQYIYDHRYDDAMYLNQALVNQFLSQWEKCFQEKAQMASVYAGPACIEVYGEPNFLPETKKENAKYTSKQEKMAVQYKRDLSLIQNRYIPGDEYSFTIIAYPVPEIGPKFKEIFDATVKVNTLDVTKYRQIQQKLIDALDQGEMVHVTGRGKNHTDICVALHPLQNPEKETIFENCLADVNIPLGEVFTSPRLAGTNGVLHVTEVYLEGMRYDNLEVSFVDGMISDYNCSNYKEEAENRAYFKENVMHNRETLPMGEFAIGTNTTAYAMGQKFHIQDLLPVLIAEKTGPHFAVGDTCYSMCEENVVKNPDGKEVIARDNECSLHRKDDMEKAYFNCHTDITIPYSELGDIVVCCKDGGRIKLLSEGRFVLPGTEELNEAIVACENID